MKSFLLPAVVFALAAIPCVSTVKADTFTFSFGTAHDPHSGSGTLTGIGLDVGVDLITGITGVTDGSPIGGLLDANSFEGNDNLLFFPADSHGAFFSNGGLSYFVDLPGGQTLDVNLFAAAVTDENGEIFGDEDDLRLPLTVALGTAPSPVPEPGSIVLLGGGAVGLASMIRRRLAR